MPRLDVTKGKKRRRWLLLPIAFLALPLALKMFGMQPTNRASTTPESSDALLRTRLYEASPGNVRAQVLEVVPALSTYGQKWRVKRVVPGIDDVPEEIQCEVPVLVFTDDISIFISAEAGGTRVDARSASRVGRGDFGENARHIRQILSALDERLGPSRG